MRNGLFALLCFSINAAAQAPATPPPPVPADVSPLYVITYVELKPTAAKDGTAILKSWRESQGKAAGNLRSEVVHHTTRPGQFVVVAAWQNKAAFDAYADAGK